MTHLKLISDRELEALGYGSKREIKKKVRERLFPAPVDVGYGEVRWRAADIEDWLMSRPAYSDRLCAW